MELYRCREKLYSMSKAVKFNTAKRSIFSCSFSGLSHTSIHDIFSTVCPASARIPSKRSNRSTQWYNSHWRKRKKRIRCLCGFFVTMDCWVWHLDKFTSHLCFSSIPHQYRNPWERLCFEPHGHEFIIIACSPAHTHIHTPLDATKPFAKSSEGEFWLHSEVYQNSDSSLPELILPEVFIFSYLKKILLN